MSKVEQLKRDLRDIPTGYGLMSLTWRTYPVEKDVAFAAMKQVIDIAKKANHKAFFDVGEFYGSDRINLVYVKEFFEKYPELRSDVIISCKGAANNETLAPMGKYEDVLKSVRACCEAIGGYIDIFEPARLDKSQCEDGSLYPYSTFSALASMVEEGVIHGISLSEVNAEEISAVAKDWMKYLVCVEVELSLFSKDILFNGVAKVCGELGLPIICYSPLGRGLLTGKISSVDDIPEGDYRKFLKRFHGDSLKQNFLLVNFLQSEIADKRDASKPISKVQIALGWIKHWNGSKEYSGAKFIPIPSGSTAEKVSENFDEEGSKLSEEEFAKINDFLKEFKTAGDRYERV